MTDSMIGRTLGRYQVDSKLGQGGMGMVYKATQASLNRTVAIKVLPAQLAMDSEFVERFRQEAQVIASLQHESIVHVYDIDQQRLANGENLYFIVMEFVDGETLRSVVLRQQRLPADQVRSVGIAVAQALEYAHGRGIIHRDIKSANVMVTRSGKVKLMDFGIAKAAGGVKTMTGSVLGTPDYMAPEQARSGKVSAQSDLYSLGVMLFEVATGQMPFTAGDPFAVALKHLTEPAPAARSLVPDLPPWLDAVILRLMAKEPPERYPSAQDLLRDLRREVFTPSTSATVEEGIPTVATPKGGIPPVVPPASPGAPATWPPPPPASWQAAPPTGSPPTGSPPTGPPPVPSATTWAQPGSRLDPTPPSSSPLPWGATPPPTPLPSPQIPPPTPAGAWGASPTPAWGHGGYAAPPASAPLLQTPAPLPAATAFDVPRAAAFFAPLGGKVLWIALFLLALILGIGGGAWFTRRDRVELKPAPGAAIGDPNAIGDPKSAPAKGEPSSTPAAPRESTPSSPTPRPSTDTAPARREPSYSQVYPPASPSAPQADPTRPAPREPDLAPPADTDPATGPSTEELWREAVRLKDNERYHSLRATLDQLLAQDPDHAEARAWRKKADGWVSSRNKDLQDELEDQLDCLAEAISETELSDAAECWGGSLDQSTQAFLVGIWRDYRKPKLEYRVLSSRPWDQDIEFEAQLTIKGRDQARWQKTWRGKVAADRAGVRFATPLN